MNNHCLFCTQKLLEIFYLDCREKDESTLFEFLLTPIGKASNTDNYYDQIKFICQRIETVSSLCMHSRLHSIVYLVGVAVRTDSVYTHLPF